MTRPTLIILAGGKGTRLSSVTKDKIPKPMVQVEGKPFLYWLLLWYWSQGFRNIILSVNYLASKLEKYPWPVPVTFINDKHVPLSDLGRFYNASWVANGDTWICDPLPEIVDDQPTIMTLSGVDAGAHFVNHYQWKTKLVRCQFIDIGIPDSLAYFRRYFKTHIVDFMKECEHKYAKGGVL